MNKEIWLWLVLVMLPYNPQTIQLVEQYGDVRTAAEAIRDGRCSTLSDEERARASAIRSREVNELISLCDSNGINIITYEDDEYPELLHNIYNPPAVLFVQGSLDCLKNAVALTVVGTRSCSEYAAHAAATICAELSGLGIVTVSGLAVGIDSIAHCCALDNGAPTVGVLACGSLVDYPASSRSLKQRIIENGGAVITELLPYAGVDKDYFKHRNRIMAGLSHGTFVVEAPEVSGCRFTAEAAIQQGRELFCLPPYNVFNKNCSGVMPYLRDGAAIVFGSVDIVNALKYHIFGKID